MADLSFVNTREFSRLISRPSTLTVFDMAMLEDLVALYPFSYPLHVSYAFTLKKYKPEKFDQYLSKAAAYIPDRLLLYEIINNIAEFENPRVEEIPVRLLDTLEEVEQTSVEVAYSESNGIESAILEETIIELPQRAELENRSESNDEFSEFEMVETEEHVDISASETETKEPVLEISGHSEHISIVEEQEQKETFIAGSPDLTGSLNEFEKNEKSEPEEKEEDAERLVNYFKFNSDNFDNNIETIIPFSERLSFENSIESDEAGFNSVSDAPAESAPAQNQIIGSIASSDYFVFDKSAIDPLLKEEESDQLLPVVVEKANVNSADEETLSLYDDDKLPLSFLWWLDKTRKEHSETYQPYATKSPVKPQDIKKHVSGQLDHQIIENIFHIQPEINVFQNGVNKPSGSGPKGHEDLIIEKFISEDPQIGPPKADRLDTENKARKSSEDRLDLVSETLAKIYTDQMLYHKAIDTYQKLSLKFPEKSAYFAGQIRDLEKKFN